MTREERSACQNARVSMPVVDVPIAAGVELGGWSVEEGDSAVGRRRVGGGGMVVGVDWLCRRTRLAHRGTLASRRVGREASEPLSAMVELLIMEIWVGSMRDTCTSIDRVLCVGVGKLYGAVVRSQVR